MILFSLYKHYPFLLTIHQYQFHQSINQFHLVFPFPLYLFPKIKREVRCCYFNSDDDVKAAVNHFLEVLDADFFKGIHVLYDCQVKMYKGCGGATSWKSNVLYFLELTRSTSGLELIHQPLYLSHSRPTRLSFFYILTEDKSSIFVEPLTLVSSMSWPGATLSLCEMYIIFYTDSNKTLLVALIDILGFTQYVHKSSHCNGNKLDLVLSKRDFWSVCPANHVCCVRSFSFSIGGIIGLSCWHKHRCIYHTTYWSVFRCCT